MGSAIVGSAVTTLGASVFLLPCTMQIFVKLAVVLFAVTTLACIFSVTALPAALLCFGSAKSCMNMPKIKKARFERNVQHSEVEVDSVAPVMQERRSRDARPLSQE